MVAVATDRIVKALRQKMAADLATLRERANKDI